MEWVAKEAGWRIPVKSWCRELEKEALEQAKNLASHPAAFHHVALMPDAHKGYGMPIGGVLALKDAVCPNAVGVDIGCGMVAVKTDVPAAALADMAIRRRRSGRECAPRARAEDVSPADGSCRRTRIRWFALGRFWAWRKSLPKRLQRKRGR